MIDAKMQKTLSGLGGAFCLLCHADKDTASGRGVDEPKDYFYHHSNWGGNKKEVRRPGKETIWVSDYNKR